MLKEIVYWTYRFFSNLRRSQKKKDDDGRWDSTMFVSVCLFTNVLTLLNTLEKHSNIAILEKIPITTKYEFSSWVCIILIMIPFIAIVYSRYFRKDKLSKILEEYAAKSKKRLMLGNFLVFCYILLTWVGFFMSLD